MFFRCCCSHRGALPSSTSLLGTAAWVAGVGPEEGRGAGRGHSEQVGPTVGCHFRDRGSERRFSGSPAQEPGPLPVFLSAQPWNSDPWSHQQMPWLPPWSLTGSWDRVPKMKGPHTHRRVSCSLFPEGSSHSGDQAGSAASVLSLRGATRPHSLWLQLVSCRTWQGRGPRSWAGDLGRTWPSPERHHGTTRAASPLPLSDQRGCDFHAGGSWLSCGLWPPWAHRCSWASGPRGALRPHCGDPWPAGGPLAEGQGVGSAEPWGRREMHLPEKGGSKGSHAAPEGCEAGDGNKGTVCRAVEKPPHWT